MEKERERRMEEDVPHHNVSDEQALLLEDLQKKVRMRAAMVFASDASGLFCRHALRKQKG